MSFLIFNNFYFYNFFKNILIFNFNNYFIFYFNYFFYFINFFFFNKVFKFSYYFFSYYFYLIYTLFLKVLHSLNYYFIEFFLDGLYYRIKYYKNFNILGFIIGYNHYIYYKIPENIKCKVHMKKRRFFLYSFNFNLLALTSLRLVNLKFPNLYKGKGIKIFFIKFRKKIILKKK